MSHSSIDTFEFTATEVRIILQDLFPARKLVLSQLTFFNQSGVCTPSGEKVIRGRKCYRVQDLLPIALVLALKEQGIPNKNVALVPSLVKEHSEFIFLLEDSCQISGTGDYVHLALPGSQEKDQALEHFLSGSSMDIFWSYDVGSLAKEICRVTERLISEGRFDSSNEAAFATKEAIARGHVMDIRDDVVYANFPLKRAVG